MSKNGLQNLLLKYFDIDQYGKVKGVSYGYIKYDERSFNQILVDWISFENNEINTFLQNLNLESVLTETDIKNVLFDKKILPPEISNYLAIKVPPEIASYRSVLNRKRTINESNKNDVLPVKREAIDNLMISELSRIFSSSSYNNWKYKYLVENIKDFGEEWLRLKKIQLKKEGKKIDQNIVFDLNKILMTLPRELHITKKQFEGKAEIPVEQAIAAAEAFARTFTLGDENIKNQEFPNYESLVNMCLATWNVVGKTSSVYDGSHMWGSSLKFIRQMSGKDMTRFHDSPATSRSSISVSRSKTIEAKIQHQPTLKYLLKFFKNVPFEKSTKNLLIDFLSQHIKTESLKRRMKPEDIPTLKASLEKDFDTGIEIILSNTKNLYDNLVKYILLYCNKDLTAINGHVKIINEAAKNKHNIRQSSIDSFMSWLENEIATNKKAEPIEKHLPAIRGVLQLLKKPKSIVVLSKPVKMALAENDFEIGLRTVLSGNENTRGSFFQYLLSYCGKDPSDMKDYIDPVVMKRMIINENYSLKMPVKDSFMSWLKEEITTNPKAGPIEGYIPLIDDITRSYALMVRPKINTGSYVAAYIREKGFIHNKTVNQWLNAG